MFTKQKTHFFGQNLGERKLFKKRKGTLVLEMLTFRVF